jgi:hypothetical protein
MAGASLIGGLAQADAAKDATKSQVNSAQQQMAFNQQVYNDQQAAFQPYQQAGTNALGAYNYLLGLGPKPAGYAGFEQSPGFDFQLSQGQRAIDGSAASRGGVFSGATLKAQQQFGTGLAQQDFYNYLAQLSGLSNMGTNAAGMTATAGSNFGAGQGNALASIGNAQAAGAIGVGNAINSGIGNALGTYNYMQMMQQPATVPGMSTTNAGYGAGGLY